MEKKHLLDIRLDVLRLACQYGSQSKTIIEECFKFGLDLNDQSENPMTPLLAVTSASGTKNCESWVVRKLLEHGANPNLVYNRNGELMTPLKYARRLPNASEIIEILLEYNATE